MTCPSQATSLKHKPTPRIAQSGLQSFSATPRKSSYSSMLLHSFALPRPEQLRYWDRCRTIVFLTDLPTTTTTATPNAHLRQPHQHLRQLFQSGGMSLTSVLCI